MTEQQFKQVLMGQAVAARKEAAAGQTAWFALALGALVKPLKSVAGWGAMGFLGLTVLAPAAAGAGAGLVQSKVTSPDKKELATAQTDALTEELKARTARLEALPPRQTPRAAGRDALWRP